MFGSGSVALTCPSRPSMAPQHSCGYVSRPCAWIAATTSCSRLSESTSVHPAHERALGRLLPESLRQVFLAAVREDHHDDAGLERVRDAEAGGQGGATRDPDQKALFEREPLRQQ